MGSADLSVAVWKLVLACLLGGMVGWQRESHERPAGFRTHTIVCVGSCLVMLVSIGTAMPAFPGAPQFDPGRIAAQVVSGIGFLGAGTILRQGSAVRGLTTAASLWTVAAIGLAVGLGGDYATIGAIATALVLAALTIFRRLETLWPARVQLHELHVAVAHEHVNEVMSYLTGKDVAVRRVRTAPPEASGIQRMDLVVRIPESVGEGELLRDLLALSGVREVGWG